MIDPKDNLPAFPGKLQFSQRGGCANSDAEFRGGMTLLDYFAGEAMDGLIARTSTEFSCRQLADEMRRQGIDDERRPEWAIAKCAYDYAEAMLAERKRRMEGGK